MKKYNVIIIGAGIAGSGLAYNLKNLSYDKNVLIIDKKNLEKNSDEYRITFKEIVNKYKLPYEKKYNSLKFHFSEDGVIDINGNFFLLDYKRVCHSLIKNSSFEFRNEKAIDIKENTLITDKNSYAFDYLIDCSGSHFFFKKIKNKKLPIKYWIGYSKILKSDNSLSKNSFHYFFHEDGVFEDIYSMGDKIMYGYWKYVNKIDFNLINTEGKSLARKMINDKYILKQFTNIVPCSPAFPLKYKNIAFLGDSFGNSTPSGAEGIRPILNSSELLSHSIKKHNLDLYEKEWKEKYLNSYIKFLAFRMIRYPSSNFFKEIKKRFLPNNSVVYNYLKKDPELLLKIIKNEDTFKSPQEFKKCFNKLNIILLALLYYGLKLKYAIN